VAEACRKASDVGLPVTHGSGPLLGEHVRSQGIEISDRSASRILQDADLQPHRPQMYLTSHDDVAPARDAGDPARATDGGGRHCDL